MVESNEREKERRGEVNKMHEDVTSFREGRR